MKENRSLEYKQDITNTFLKTVSAFANFGDGTIMFGIDDNGKTVGIQDPDHMCLDIENRINDNISPKPDYSISVNRRTKVISLFVREGKYKPYLYKGKAYRRSDTASIEVDQLELRRLTLEGENLYYEELPSNTDKLSFDYLEFKFKEILGIKELNSDILRTLGLLNEDKKYNIAAELFADINKYSGIDIARFGATINEIMDRETLARMSILQQYDKAVEIYKRYYQYEKIESIERKNVEIIPEAAFREAVANALVHRTWDINVHIRIAMFSDRIEITSPGGLPRGISKEEYLNGYISIMRNPIIGNIFFRLRLIEMFGTGIRRIIDAYENAPLQPAFDISDNAVRIILPSLINTFSGTKESQSVLELLNSKMQLSGREISEALGWSKNKTIRILNSLISDGYIKKIGSARGTKYSKS